MLLFGFSTVLELWYIYTSRAARRRAACRRSGAAWARGHSRAHAPRFGDERRELHSTHSLQGKLAVLHVPAASASSDSVLVVGPLDGARPALPEHAVRLVVLHGRVALRAHGWSLLVQCVAHAISDGGRSHHRSALPRHRQALLRVHGVLGLPHVRPVPRDLVRQHGRGDALHAAAPRSRRGVGRRWRRCSSCSSSRSSGCCRARRRSICRRSSLFARRSLVGMWLHALHRGLSVAVRRDSPSLPFGIWEIGVALGFLGAVGLVLPRRSWMPSRACA